MNVEILQDSINAYRREVIDSGFRRDLEDYTSSLPASENNIVALREIASKILSTLDVIYGGDLGEHLTGLLPGAELTPFTSEAHGDVLHALVDNTEIEQPQFFRQLTQFVNLLRGQIEQNTTEIDRIEEFIRPYISEDVKRIADEGLAMLAIVFNEHETISNLGQFTSTLVTWDRVLPIYHQLLKSESPADIQIVEVQNGSIDFIVNLDIDVALDLVALFKLGFKVFAAYLSYKKMIQPIIATYYGNKKLVSQEAERESMLLQNIESAVQDLLKSQHENAKKQDKAIDNTAIAKKVSQVLSLVTSHIVKGNDIKLLALPETVESSEGDEIETGEHIEALREQSLEARRQLRQIPPDAHAKLLEAYSKSIEDIDA